MKKLFLIILISLSLISLAGCALNNNDKYPEFKAVTNEELGCVELHYNGIIYRPYGGFYNNDFRGKQIGTRDGDAKIKISEIKGYDSSEWITEFDDIFMGGGDMLFKAVGVTTIPADLEKYKLYDY